MPYQLTPGPEYLRIAFSGRITRREFGDAMRQLVAIESAGDRVPDRLTDLSAIELSELTAEDIQELARGRRETRYANSFRSAIFAPKPAQFGYGRMFQILNSHPSITLQVFTEETMAVAWLRESTSRTAADRPVASA